MFDRVLAAWERVKLAVPSADVMLVTSLSVVPQSTFYNPAACAECDFGTRAIKFADNWDCATNPSYPEQALMHELGHIYFWTWFQDASEEAADSYVAWYWAATGLPFGYELRTREDLV